MIVKKAVSFYFSQDKVVVWSILLAFILAFFSFIFWFVNIGRLPFQLPLFYSKPWGESQMANLLQFTILPTTSILFTLINYSISWYLHDSQILFKRILALSSLIYAILIFVTSIKIITIFI